MVGRRLLLLLLLLAACATPTSRGPAAAPAPAAGRLPLVGTPTLYELALDLDPRLPRYGGRTRLHLRLPAPTRAVPFHAVAMEITSVEALVGERRIPGEVRVTGSDDPTRGDFGVHEAVFPEDLAAGPVVLEFVHSSPFDPSLAGLYRAQDSAGRWYAYSQLEVAEARRVFPSLDEPAFKTPFRVTLRVPRGMQAFSNAPARSAVDDGTTVTVTFAETPPLPTYLLAFVVGEVDVVEGEAPLRVLVPKGRMAHTAFALEAHAALLPILETYFGRPYPYAKLDLAAALEFAAGAMENPGLILYREEVLLPDPARAPAAALTRSLDTFAHELAHMWFGNLVTLRWWDDTWLNEAFATWMAAKTVDLWQPEHRLGLELLQSRGWVMGRDALQSARAVRQPVTSVSEAERAFDGITYTKGASVLAMLEAWAGEETFRAGVRAYLDAHAHGTADAEALFAALAGEANVDIAGVARSFVDRAGVPLLEVALHCAEGEAPQVRMTQTRYRALGGRTPEGLPDGEAWRIPVQLAWPTPEGVARRWLLFDAPEALLSLEGGCPAWVHPNAGEYGYYRWAVPADWLPALTQAGLDERSRTALVDQTWAMVSAGRLPPADALGLFESMTATGDPQVLEAVVSRVGVVGHTWPELARTEAFAAWVSRLLEPAALRLGWVPAAGEDRQTRALRPRLLEALGWWGRADWVRSRAFAQAQAWMADPRSGSPDLAQVSLNLAARAGRLDPDRLLALAATSEDPTVRVAALGALGHLPPGPALTRAFEAAVEGGGLRTQDLFYVLRPALQDPDSRDAAFALVQSHWDALAKRLPAYGWSSLSRLPAYTGAFCSETELSAARRFFESRAIRGGAPSLAEGVERAEQCIALSRWGRPSLASFLERGL